MRMGDMAKPVGDTLKGRRNAAHMKKKMRREDMPTGPDNPTTGRPTPKQRALRMASRMVRGR
jgi:hypothetical protein